MASRAAFRHEEVAAKPRGWRVRTLTHPSGHRVRVAFPKGPRRRGGGRLISILHPKSERRNPCPLGRQDAESDPKLAARVLKFFGVQTSAKPKNPEPAERARSLFRRFHGRAPARTTELEEPGTPSGAYTALGQLSELRVKLPDRREFRLLFNGNGITLASSPDGRQLYAVGGQQSLEPHLDEVAPDETKQDLDLGEALRVHYVARKSQAGFRPIEYVHRFGEESGARPRLIYHRASKRLSFAGGNYRVEAPGIVD